MDNPLIKQQEYYRKLIELEDLINSNPDARELKRAIAVKMAKLARRLTTIEGHADRMITQVLGVSASFIRDWKKAFRVGGVAGIKRELSG